MTDGIREYLGIVPAKEFLLPAAVFLAAAAVILFCFRKNRRVRRMFHSACALLVICVCVLIAYRMPDASLSEHPGSFTEIPEYTGEPVTVINGNVPFFTPEDLKQEPFESYGTRDSLGRCTGAYAMISLEFLPEGERESIQDIHPTGWQNVRYDGLVDEGYLYHRCHLIAYGLTGENANPDNLITGTQYMNIEGMRPYEYQTVSYIRRTGGDVLYRSTPVFTGSDLVCRGVLLEAYSVDDDGQSICFCVFCHNVQPGIVIDYAGGYSRRK